MKFTKMQGLGNDYVYINCFEEKVENPSELAVKVSDRRFGIGSDGLILIMPSKSADFRMRMFNADGSEAEMCGNGIRCVGKYVFDNRLTEKKRINIETLAGIKVLDLIVDNGKVNAVKVDMGEPVLEPSKIPVKSGKEKVVSEILEVGGTEYRITCVSMGNPHAVIYTDDLESLDIEKIGPLLETNSIFPRKANIEFVRVIDKKTLEMRVWERGAGETFACGTGACAVLVSSVLNGLSDRKAVVILKGGNLDIEWDAENNHVYMTGPAVTVFNGHMD